MYFFKSLVGCGHVCRPWRREESSHGSCLEIPALWKVTGLFPESGFKSRSLSLTDFRVRLHLWTIRQSSLDITTEIRNYFHNLSHYNQHSISSSLLCSVSTNSNSSPHVGQLLWPIDQHNYFTTVWLWTHSSKLCRRLYLFCGHVHLNWSLLRVMGKSVVHWVFFVVFFFNEMHKKR